MNMFTDTKIPSTLKGGMKEFYVCCGLHWEKIRKKEKKDE